MNLRHAAVLALVGWYLIVAPPQSFKDNKYYEAPLSQSTSSAFATAAACKAEHAKRQAIIERGSCSAYRSPQRGTNSYLTSDFRHWDQLGTLTGDTVGAAPQMLPPDITPEETAIRAAVARNAWISKVSHVTQVLPGVRKDSEEMVIFVIVDKNENVGAVERELPSRIEGFPVEVGGPTMGEFLKSIGSTERPATALLTLLF
jgi:hypothetical protein